MISFPQTILTVAVILALANVSIAKGFRATSVIIDQPSNIDDSVILRHGVHVYKGTKIGSNSEIMSKSEVREDAEIGRNVKIGENTIIESRGKVGNNVQIGDNVLCESATVIEDNVDIEDNALIRSGARVLRNANVGDDAVLDIGVTIGRSADIGNGAYVDANIGSSSILEQFAIAYGNIPSKVIVKTYQIGISPPTSKQLTSILKSFNYESEAASIDLFVSLDDDKFNEYMLKGLQKVITFASTRCASDPKNFNEFKTLLFVYLRRHHKASSEKLKAYIAGGEYPELNDTHFGRYRLDTLSVDTLNEFKKAWVLYLEGNRDAKTRTPNRSNNNYCETVKRIVEKTSRVHILEEEKVELISLEKRKGGDYNIQGDAIPQNRMHGKKGFLGIKRPSTKLPSKRTKPEQPIPEQTIPEQSIPNDHTISSVSGDATSTGSDASSTGSD